MEHTFYAPNDYRSYLEHHGIKGMKWGVRRFQNNDGSYTSAGKSRYGVGDGQPYKGVRSVKGNLWRASAKINGFRAKNWNRIGAKRMGAMYKSASDYAKNKANEADSAKAARMAKSKRKVTQEYKGGLKSPREVYKNLTPAQRKRMLKRLAGSAALVGAGVGLYAYSRNPQAFKNAASNARNAMSNFRNRPIVEGVGSSSRKGRVRLADPRRTAFKQRAGQYARAAKYKAQDIGRGLSGGAANARNAARKTASNARQFASDYSMRFKNRDRRLAGSSPKISGRADAIKRGIVNGMGRAKNAASNARGAASNATGRARQFASDYSMRFKNRDRRLAGSSPKVSGRADAIKRGIVNGMSGARNAASNARGAMSNFRNRPIVEGVGSSSRKGRVRLADPRRAAFRQRAGQYARAAQYRAQDIGRGVTGGAANARNAARKTASNARQFASDYSMRFKNRDRRLAGSSPKVSGRADAIKRGIVNGMSKASNRYRRRRAR